MAPRGGPTPVLGRGRSVPQRPGPGPGQHLPQAQLPPSSPRTREAEPGPRPSQTHPRWLRGQGRAARTRARRGGAWPESRAYLGEDVQLAHDVLQRAGQRLRRAGRLPRRALRRLLAPRSARDVEVHLWLKTRRGGTLSGQPPLRRAGTPRAGGGSGSSVWRNGHRRTHRGRALCRLPFSSRRGQEAGGRPQALEALGSS